MEVEALSLGSGWYLSPGPFGAYELWHIRRTAENPPALEITFEGIILRSVSRTPIDDVFLNVN